MNNFEFLAVSVDHHIKSYNVIITEGVLIQQTFICDSDLWEYAILGIEALTLIVGVGLGIQVRYFCVQVYLTIIPIYSKR